MATTTQVLELSYVAMLGRRTCCILTRSLLQQALSPAVQNAVEYLQALLDAEASGVTARHRPIPILAPATIAVDSTDLNDTKVMLSDPSVTSTGSVASTSDTEGDDDDEQEEVNEDDYVEPEDIVRHHWHRGDINTRSCW
jgi:hypothetical protein